MSTSLSSEGIVVNFGGNVLVSDRDNATIFASISIGEIGLVLILVFSLGSTKEKCISFLDDRERSGK